MQIIMSQAEIETAITNYVFGNIPMLNGQKLGIEMKATRGESGFQAFISLAGDEASAGAAQAVSRVNAAAPKTLTAARAPRNPTEVRQMLADEAQQEAEQGEQAGVEEEAAQPVAEEPVVAEEEQVAAQPNDPEPEPEPQVAQAVVQQKEATPTAPAASSVGAGTPRRLFSGLKRNPNE